jgi:hypothetical protein
LNVVAANKEGFWYPPPPMLIWHTFFVSMSLNVSVPKCEQNNKIKAYFRNLPVFFLLFVV